MDIRLLAVGLCGAVLAGACTRSPQGPPAAAPGASAPSFPDHGQVRGVAVFAGVDGVSYSTGTERFGAYAGYEERVVTVTLAPVELARLADRLVAAAASHARPPAEPAMSIPPQTYDLLLVTGRGTERMRFWNAPGYSVPAPVLDVLASLPAARRPPVLDRFIEANRRLAGDGG